MKHSKHIERCALGQTVGIWRKVNPEAKWKVTASEIGASPRRCLRALEYFEKHGNEPSVPELGHLRHEDIVRLGVRGMAHLKETLIRNFSATIGLSKPPPKMSNRDIKQLSDACGLETFRHKGRRVIHWKRQ